MKTQFTPEAAANLLISVCRDAMSEMAKLGITDPVAICNMADTIAEKMQVSRGLVLEIWEAQDRAYHVAAERSRLLAAIYSRDAAATIAGMPNEKLAEIKKMIFA